MRLVEMKTDKNPTNLLNIGIIRCILFGTTVSLHAPSVGKVPMGREVGLLKRQQIPSRSTVVAMVYDAMEELWIHLVRKSDFAWARSHSTAGKQS